jgi:hypothetical protein
MKATRILLIGSVGLLVTTAAVIAQAAPLTSPTLGAASITVDQQIHLGAASSLFKGEKLFLWDDDAAHNTALGRSALSSNTTDHYYYGVGNTAVGWSALALNTTGSYNTAVGDGALSYNETGVENTAVGNTALQGNTTGSQNTAVGINALHANQTGFHNTSVGFQALFNNTDGYANTALGSAALWSNIGDDPATEGYEGSLNTAIGYQVLSNNTYGRKNTGIGYSALTSNDIGSYNTATGGAALDSNATGSSNTATGFNALRSNTSGSRNTAIGDNALTANIGSYNTAAGTRALYSNTTGSTNIALGYKAGYSLGYGVTTPLTSMSHNIFIGNEGETDEEQVIRIGSTQNTTFIAGIDDQTLTVSANPVCVEPTGQLGRCPAPSSRRYKEDIQDLGAGTERLLELRPVTFRFKEEIAGEETALQFGLIAEEVAEVFPELLSYDEEGRPDGVKYRFLSSLLLNELQKQAVEIQRVKARLERLEAAESPRRTALRGPP